MQLFLKSADHLLFGTFFDLLIVRRVVKQREVRATMSFHAVYGHTTRLVSNWNQLINGRCFLAEEYLILVAVTNKLAQ